MLTPQESHVIEELKQLITQIFEGDSSGHDSEHMLRVWRTAKKIAHEEEKSSPQIDTFVVEAGALLHDVIDWKLEGTEQAKNQKMIEDFFAQFNEISTERIQHLWEVIQNVSFKGQGVQDTPPSLEGKIVQDADRLDAIGAIGIARAFAYGGSKGRVMHDPLQVPVTHTNFDQYQKNQSTTINHFYEKLLHLKDRLHTKSGKEIGEERHKFLEQFLQTFLQEWGK